MLMRKADILKNTQAGAKASLQLFVCKIIQKLINNNTRINSVLHTYSCSPTLVSSWIVATLHSDAHSPGACCTVAVCFLVT